MAGRASFDDFVRTRGAHLIRIAYLLTHDRHHAEDLVQTALVRSWSAWRRINGDPEPYVRRVLINAYASWRGRRWHGEVPSDALPDSDSTSPHVHVDDRDALWRALGRLPYQQRAVLVLRYYEDMTEAQIADALGIASGTVKAHASRALSTLRLDASLRAEVPSATGVATLDGGPSPAAGELSVGGIEADRFTSAITTLADLPGVDATSSDDLAAGTRGRIRRRRIQRAVTVTTALALVIAAVVALLVTAGVRVHAAPPINPPIRGFQVGDYVGGTRIVATETASTRAGSVSLTWTPTTTDEMIFTACIWPNAPEDSLIEPSADRWAVEVSYDGRNVAGSYWCDLSSTFDGGPGMGFDPGSDRIGVPTTVTAHLDGAPSNAPNATPISSGTMYIAIAEAVPFQDYPLPSRPATLIPITCDGWPRDQIGNELTDMTLLGPDAPGGRMSVTLPPGTYDITAESQTPGIATVIAAGKPDKRTFSFYDYLAGMAAGFPIVVDKGSSLTLSVTTEYMTGDWWIGIRTEGRSATVPPCPS